MNKTFRRVTFLLVLLSLFSGAFALDLGTATLEPDSAVVGEQGDWKVRFKAGNMGVAIDGGVRFQFPHAWFVHPWGSDTKIRLQTENSSEPHFAKAETSRPGVRFEYNIHKESVDLQHDRWQQTCDVIIRENPLLPGDEVIFTLASRPAPLISETHPVAVGVDPSGNELFIPLGEYPRFTVKPGKAEKMLVFLPSKAKVNETVPLRIVALDAYNNRSESYRGTTRISCEKADIEHSHTFSQQERGILLKNLSFDEEGIYTVTVRDPELAGGAVFESNPIQVSTDEPAVRYFWGDPHSHCGISKDGVAEALTAFLNARDVFALDFYAMTDHSVGDKCALHDWTEGITPEEWELTQKLVKEFYHPGKFVTFLSYEWSSPAPYGHHNVFYKTDSAPFFDLKHHTTVEDLWAKLENWDVFTVPHHTAIMWRGINSPFVDWTHKSDQLRPAVEIYSLHGACEFFNNPMKYEEYDFTPTSSNFGPYYARDGWAAGNWMAAVGGSDNHTAHPGQPHGGLTCVMAPELTREAVFDAIMNRRAYATTGARILLDFRINGHIMGDRFSLSRGEKPEIRIDAVGTAPIDFIELMRYSGEEWTSLEKWEPDGEVRHLELAFTDNDPGADNIYYFRLKQKGKFFGRDVMAWSTPIWVGEKYGE